MKYDNSVSSKPGKNRKKHFTAGSLQRRKLMSAPLSKALRSQYHVRRLPIRAEDTVQVIRGKHKDSEGKVETVYRLRWCIHVERLVREDARTRHRSIAIKPSNCIITKLHLDKDRKALLERRNRDNMPARKSLQPKLPTTMADA